MSIRLSPRLSSAAQFVRQDAVFADIGTDHAYLPIFLLEAGRIRSAIASDINKGPLESARRNAKERGLDGKMTFVLTDGAAALADLGITDYAICGMGGELIADIIAGASQLRDGSVRLILQPMSKQADLRKYLYQNGFEIERESYSQDAGKYYVTMAVKYTKAEREITNGEAELGLKIPDFVNKNAQIGYFKAKKNAFERRMCGKTLGGDDVENEVKLLAEINSFLELLEKYHAGT